MNPNEVPVRGTFQPGPRDRFRIVVETHPDPTKGRRYCYTGVPPFGDFSEAVTYLMVTNPPLLPFDPADPAVSIDVDVASDDRPGWQLYTRLKIGRGDVEPMPDTGCPRELYKAHANERGGVDPVPDAVVADPPGESEGSAPPFRGLFTRETLERHGFVEVAPGSVETEARKFVKTPVPGHRGEYVPGPETPPPTFAELFPAGRAYSFAESPPPHPVVRALRERVKCLRAEADRLEAMAAAVPMLPPFAAAALFDLLGRARL